MGMGDVKMMAMVGAFLGVRRRVFDNPVGNAAGNNYRYHYHRGSVPRRDGTRRLADGAPGAADWAMRMVCVGPSPANISFPSGRSSEIAGVAGGLLWSNYDAAVGRNYLRDMNPFAIFATLQASRPANLSAFGIGRRACRSFSGRPGSAFPGQALFPCGKALVKKKTSPTPRTQNPSAFMAASMQGVIQKLRDQEKELERLHRIEKEARRYNRAS